MSEKTPQQLSDLLIQRILKFKHENGRSPAMVLIHPETRMALFELAEKETIAESFEPTSHTQRFSIGHGQLSPDWFIGVQLMPHYDLEPGQFVLLSMRDITVRNMPKYNSITGQWER